MSDINVQEFMKEYLAQPHTGHEIVYTPCKEEAVNLYAIRCSTCSVHLGYVPKNNR